MRNLPFFVGIPFLAGKNTWHDTTVHAAGWPFKGGWQGQMHPVGTSRSLSGFWYYWPWYPPGQALWGWDWGHSFELAPILPWGPCPESSAREEVSVPWTLWYGVPQGLALSLTLFKIYLKLSGEVIKRSAVWGHQYTNEIQLYLSVTISAVDAIQMLERCCLGSVLEWIRADMLKLNLVKTEICSGGEFLIGHWDGP